MAILALASATGCQRDHTYEIRGTVKDAADGAALDGVRITAEDPEGPAGSATTATDGTFTLKQWVNAREFGGGQKPKLVIRFSKEGFADETAEFVFAEPAGYQLADFQILTLVMMRAKP